MGISIAHSDEHMESSALRISVENNDEISPLLMGNPRRSDAGQSIRGNGYPFKRVHSNGVDLNPYPTNGGNRELAQFGSKGKSHTIKPGRVEKSEGFGRKSRPWVYSILISFGIACFLAEALLQDSIMTFLRHSELPPSGSTGVDRPTLEQVKILEPSGIERTFYFGETIKFMPAKFLQNHNWAPNGRNNLSDAAQGKRHSIRSPQLALVCFDLSRSPGLLLLVSVAKGLQALGYDLELYSFGDGPMRAVWEKLGTPVNILQSGSQQVLTVDWLKILFLLGKKLIVGRRWLEHTLTMQAILPLMSEFYVGGGNATHLRLVIVSGNSTSTYGVALQAIALQLGFPSGSVQHVGVDGDVSVILSIADLVLYGSFREEQAFPSILVQAMSFEKPIIVPNLTIIQKYIADGKNGVLFPIGDVSIITKAVSLAISNGRLSPLAQKLALAGKEHARDLMASDAEELEERSDQPRGTWEDVYRSVKRAERTRDELHERDDGEMERSGQPLCIYEPYHGPGAWPFLHRNALYRGIGLELTDAVRMGRHGHAVYFWARMDKDTRHGTQGNASQWEDFWSFCDAINAGNCRVVFSDAFKRMYNLPESWTAIPPMPFDGDSWSVLHSWAMPTSSFLEFVMFARMFVDSLDAQHYQEHHDNGTCPLSISKLENRYCYCRVLELLVNVWAYHSARRMVYVNPETGLMQEQHKMDNRRGHMWVKWFDFGLLKAMDEDLAEEADYEHPARRWIWPSTGEIFWQGIYEREHQHQHHLKMEKRRRSKEKLGRMRSRYRQKSLGKYMKPPPQEFANNIETKDWVA